MKKITKLLVAVLSVVLLLGAVVGISASAGVLESADRWIYSANVEYGDDLHLYFAIPTSKVVNGEYPTLTVKNDKGVVRAENIGPKLGEDSTTPVTTVNPGVNCYVYITPGVSAKDMADVFTIEVHSGGQVVESIKYSVAEYFFTRLYVNSLADATGVATGDVTEEEAAKNLARKNLYFSSLRYGAAAQKLLAQDSDLLENQIHISNNGANSMSTAGSMIELGEGKWSVTSYYLDGSVVNSVVEAGKYQVNASVKIAPAAEDAAVTAASNIAPTSEYGSDFCQDNWKGYVEIIKDIVTNEPVLVVNDTHASSDNVVGGDGGQAIIRYNKATNPTGNAVRVTADMKIDPLEDGTIGGQTTFRLQNEIDSYADLMYVYYSASAGSVTIQLGSKTHVTNVSVGEWFSVEYIYEYVPAEGEGQTAKGVVTIKITNAAGEMQVLADTVDIQASAARPIEGNTTRVSVVPNKPFQGIQSVKNVKIEDYVAE